MNRPFRYSVIAVQNSEDAITQEIVFEDYKVLKTEEHLTFEINQQAVEFKITNVRKIDHIVTPNDLNDYRLMAFRI